MMNIFAFFEGTAKRYPNRTAIIYKERCLSFVDLYQWVFYYAEQLFHAGIRRNDTVALYLSNTPEAVAATLSILSLGAIVLPVNIQLPQEAVATIMEDCGARLLLYGEQTGLSDFPFRSLSLQDIVVDKDLSLIGRNTFLPLEKGDFAFCVYTSGSTGKQKGMFLSHQGILNHIQAKKEILGLNEKSIICQSFHNGFVASIWQILAPLIYGAQLVICSIQDIKNPLALLKRVQETGATVIALLPQLLMGYCRLLENGHNKLTFPYLEKIVLTGEQVSPSVVHTFYKYYTIPLINAYGQSECSDDTLHYVIPFDFDEDIVPIGVPIPQVNSFILDEQSNVIDSDNQIGELCISGICLATPVSVSSTSPSFAHIDGFRGKIFRSGDLVYRNNGLYYYCGRKDNMVKIRGHRVFLEEIERTLESFALIQQAVVIPVYQQHSVKGFEAYILCKEELDEKIVTEFLMQRLPSYAIPKVYKKVSEFKKLPNGKVLRRSNYAGSKLSDQC